MVAAGVTALVGEVQEFVDGRWRTVHLGERVAVRDRRRFVVDQPSAFPPRADRVVPPG